jgi:hypothetical protein
VGYLSRKGKELIMEFLGRIVGSATLLAVGLLPAAAPALALDYEAKPVNWVLMAPIRTIGALSGATVCGAFSGPMDKGFHNTLKSSTHIAGEFGDEKGDLQLMAATPISLPAGVTVGGTKGVMHGLVHGFKVGWDKPFSRWSYITAEEKDK